MKLSDKNKWFIVIAIAMLFWGGSWTSAKMVSSSTTSEVLIFYRFFATFLSFIPVVWIMKEPLRINKIGIVQVMFGTIFLVTYNIFFFDGIKLGLAGAGGVIVTTLNPIATFMISSIIFKQKPKGKEYIGLTLGLIGGAILMQIWEFGNGRLLDGGNLFFLLAAVSWAFLSITSQKSKSHMSPMVFSFYTYGLSAVVNFFFALPHGVFDVTSMHASFWFNILYLSIGATTFATTAYFFAASHLGANKASSFTFLVPTSAIFFSWLLLDEVPQLVTIIGGVMALSAVYVINTKPKKKSSPPLLDDLVECFE